PARHGAVRARRRAHDRARRRRGREAGRVSEPVRRRYELPDPGLEEELERLLERFQERYGQSRHAESVRQLMVTALRLVSDGASRADLKLLSNAFKELRHAFRVFAPFEAVRKVAVFGSARTPRG